MFLNLFLQANWMKDLLCLFDIKIKTQQQGKQDIFLSLNWNRTSKNVADLPEDTIVQPIYLHEKKYFFLW